MRNFKEMYLPQASRRFSLGAWPIEGGLAAALPQVQRTKLGKGYA